MFDNHRNQKIHKLKTKITIMNYNKRTITFKKKHNNKIFNKIKIYQGIKKQLNNKNLHRIQIKVTFNKI